MKRILSMLIWGGTVLAQCGVTLAAQPQRPGSAGRPGPEMMFQRLDRDGDGRVVLDEIPDGAPEFVREMLKRTDRDGDGVVTRDEFLAAMPGMGRRGEGVPMGFGRFGSPDRPPLDEQGRPDGERRPAGHPEAARRPDVGGLGVQARTRAAGAWGDPQVWFDRLDRDKDGTLSREEFAAGMRLFHQAPPSRTPSAQAPQSRGPWGAAPDGRRPALQPTWPGPTWGCGPMMQPPWWGPTWGRGPRMQPAWPSPTWGRGPIVPGRPDFDARATVSPERGEELAKRVEQARRRAREAWRRAAEMRDQVGEPPASKKETAERKKEAKKPADKPAAEGKAL